MKFKHNDKVKCTIDGTDIEDARISIDKDGTPYICQDYEKGDSVDNKLGYKYSWGLDEDFTNYDVTNLRLAEKTWDTLEIGDEVKDRDGDSRFVLDVSGRVIHLSSLINKDSYGGGYTKEELIKRYYTIVNATKEEVEELTMEEVCKELGRTIKIKK